MRKQITVRLPEEVRSKFELAAKKEKRSVNNLVEVLVERYLKEIEGVE